MKIKYSRTILAASIALILSTAPGQEPAGMTPAGEDFASPGHPGATSPKAAEGEDVGISRKDGYSVSGTDVIVTRNGVSEKLEKDVTFANGSVIKPNGMIKLSNGTELTLRSEQILSPEGQLVAAPVIINRVPDSAKIPPTPVMNAQRPAGGSMPSMNGGAGQGGAQGNGQSGQNNGSTSSPDFAGGQTNADGSITASDGSVLRADGSVQRANGSSAPSTAAGQAGQNGNGSVNNGATNGGPQTGQTTQTNNGVTSGASNGNSNTTTTNNGNSNPGVPRNGTQGTNSTSGSNNSTNRNSGSGANSGSTNSANSGGGTNRGSSNGSSGGASSGGGASGAGGASGGSAGGAGR